jgi:hypothetical protein
MEPVPATGRSAVRPVVCRSTSLLPFDRPFAVRPVTCRSTGQTGRPAGPVGPIQTVTSARRQKTGPVPSMATTTELRLHMYL